MRSTRPAALALLALFAGCARVPSDEAPLRLTVAAEGPGTRLALHPAPHFKINARLVPALESSDGAVLRFASGRLTADSAYFAEPPSVLVSGRRAEVHGTLRASVCRDDERVCRQVAIAL
jgi:hypothetical protein